MKPIELSIVIPAYNEAPNLAPLCEEIMAVMKEVGCSFEVWFVNDGSADGTVKILQDLRQRFRNVGFVSLPRNAGHQAALLRGIRASSGSKIISLDADFQHPPKVIAELWKKWIDTQSDMVQSVRLANVESVESPLKRLLSRAFYSLSNFIFGCSMVEGGADFRLMGPRLVEALKKDSRLEIFLRGFVARKTFTRELLPFVVEKRRSGESKYSFNKQIKLGILGIRELSMHNGQANGFHALCVSAFSFLYGVQTTRAGINFTISKAIVVDTLQSSQNAAKKVA